MTVRIMTPDSHTAFAAALKRLADPAARDGIARFFHDDPNAGSSDNRFLGVRFGKIFPVAKKFVGMSLADVERLLESPYYEMRMGAVSIMDFQARARKVSPDQRKALFELYIRRHDRINNWDLVDRAAPHVVGGYLANKPRGVLQKLARSKNPWERRTAIVSTWYFIRQDDVAETFRIADILANDPHELVQKAVGSWLREAGKRDQPRLLAFLHAHAAGMPRVTLRYAVEKLTAAERRTYLG
jgi:3-methyladenine DNA glycosylase AlkD